MSSTSTREAILEAAWRLMREDAARVTLSRIASEAGVSRQALYLHFQGRAGLLLAMVRWVDETSGFFERIESLADVDDPSQELEGYVRLWLDYLPELHPVPGFLARAKDDSAAREAWADRMVALEAGYRGPIRKLYRARALREGMSVKASIQAVRGVASIHAWEHLRHDCGWSQRTTVDVLWRAAAGAILRRVPE